MKIWFFFLHVIVILALWSCSSTALPERKEQSQSSEALKANQIPSGLKEAWEGEWDNIVAAAKKEGTVTVMGTGAEMSEAINSAFIRRFGIPVEFIIAKSSQLSEKIIREQRAGLYLWDVQIGGSTTKLNILKPAGVLASLNTVFFRPDILDSRNWYSGQPAFLDRDKQTLQIEYSISGDLAINTNLIRSGEIKSLRDLVNPKWKGKIIINDPTISGTGAKFVGVAATKYGWDIWREIAKLEPAIVRDENIQLIWLAQGKYAVIIAPKTERIQQTIVAGAPVASLLLEDLLYSTGSSISLLKNAPHPKASTVFINWILTQEGQTVFGKATGKSSARTDVEIEGLVTVKPKPGVEYFRSDSEDFILQQPEQMKMAQEIFAPLTK